MKTLPNTDLTVSAICLGTSNLGTTVSEADAFALLDAFVDHGGNFLDTAAVYANWIPGELSVSEKTLGRWMKATRQPRQNHRCNEGRASRPGDDAHLPDVAAGDRERH